MSLVKLRIILAGFSGLLALYSLFWILWPESGDLSLDVPAIQLKNEANEVFELQSLKGKVILVHVWAAWCAPCVEEIPELIKFARNQEKHGLRVVLIGNDKSWEKAHRVLPQRKDLPANLVAVLDPEAKAAESFGSFEFPETYLISKDYRIVTKWIGPQQWDDPFFSSFLERFYSSLGE